jgi:hypothetical protein
VKPLALLIVAIAGGLGFVGHADADVLVNAPLSRACLGHSIDVGVFRQPGSTGSASFAIRILAPGGRVVFRRSGTAVGRWQIWHYVPREIGVYRTTYYPTTRYSRFSTLVRAPQFCFSASVDGAATGPGHQFVVGDGLYLTFRDRFGTSTPYRVCWERDDGTSQRCWARRTSVFPRRASRIFTPAPQQTGQFITRWYVRGRLAATWAFTNGVGD